MSDQDQPVLLIPQTLEGPPRSTGDAKLDYPQLVDYIFRAYQVIQQTVEYINNQVDVVDLDTANLPDPSTANVYSAQLTANTAYVFADAVVDAVDINANNIIVNASNISTNTANISTNASNIAALTTHSAATVLDSPSINFTITGQQISGSVVAGGVDHGSLGGLTDDDHAQYHNDARGDVRYYQKTASNIGAPASGDRVLILDISDSNNIKYAEFSQFSGGGADLKPYCVTGSGVDITSTVATMDLSTEQIANANYALASDIITVTAAGTYQISYSVVLFEDGTTGGARQSASSFIEVNSTTTITQSQIAAYNRETGGDSGLSNSFIVELSASDTLRLRCVQAGTETNISQGVTQMSIVKLA